MTSLYVALQYLLHALTIVPTNYWVGFFGSIAVEVATGFKSCADLDGRAPERYTRWPYLGFRLALALVAGSIPVFLQAANNLSALYLGASAPLFLDKLQRGVDPAKDSKDGST